jgi:hypothetical protein
MDQYPSKISVTSLTDAEQSRLATGGILSRRQSKPRRKESPVAELVTVAWLALAGGSEIAPYPSRRGGISGGTASDLASKMLKDKDLHFDTSPTLLRVH